MIKLVWNDGEWRSVTGKGTKEREEKDSNGKKMAKNEMSKNNKEADNKVQERERETARMRRE